MQATLTRPSERSILTGALTAGVVNGVINGTFQLFLLRGHATLPLSVDGIGNDIDTVLGHAVPLAVVLAMILTAVAHLTLKAPKRRFWPSGAGLVLKHGALAFGTVVSGAILWQRVMGSVEVSLLGACAIMGLIAGLVATAINYMTIQASLTDRP